MLFPSDGTPRDFLKFFVGTDPRVGVELVGVDHFANQNLVAQQVIVHCLSYNGCHAPVSKFYECKVARPSRFLVSRQAQSCDFSKLAEEPTHLLFIKTVRNVAEVDDAMVVIRLRSRHVASTVSAYGSAAGYSRRYILTFPSVPSLSALDFFRERCTAFVGFFRACGVNRASSSGSLSDKLPPFASAGLSTSAVHMRSVQEAYLIPSILEHR